MVSMLIRFKDDTDTKSLIEFMCHQSVWKDDVQEILVLDEERIDMLMAGEREANRYLSIRVKGSTRLVELKEICSLEKIKRSILVHQKDGTSYSFYGKFKDIMSSLNGAFCRCHKSYVVNLELAEELRRYEMLLKNGVHIPVSQKKYRTVKESFCSYKKGNKESR